MRFLRTLGHSLGALAMLAVPLAAQQDTTRTTRPDTARAAGAPRREGLPLATTRTVQFTTDEGTWMSLDVSPDGRTIVFDLVGDLYTLPITGGTATRITEGPGFDAQPRWSPDGKTIVFSSDRSGAENLWLVDADGKNPKALTRGDKNQYVSPEWTPDGRYIAVSRATTDVRASTYELYLIHREGGTGVKLAGASGAGSSGAAPSNAIDNYLGPAFGGTDGRYVWVSVKRGGFGYNLQLPLWQVAVYDRETGRTYPRTNVMGSGLRPTLSPDGRWLAYATRADSVTGWRIRDLEGGDERWLVRRVDRDDQESRYTRDVMPGASFTPDSRFFVTTWGGKLWKVDVATGTPTPIPFTAEVEQKMGPLVKFSYRVNDSTLTVRQIRYARPSPDGRRLAFTALDRVWVMDLPSGTPRRLTKENVGEHSPVWSPDGRHVAYVTWTDSGGDVVRVRADGRGNPERLTRTRAFYDRPAYTPDGRRLVVSRGPRQPRIEEEGSYGTELAWLPAAGGALTVIAPFSGSGAAHFVRGDSLRLYLYAGRAGLQSMRFDGTDLRTHLRVTGFVTPGVQGPNAATPAEDIVMSPEGDRAIAKVGNNVYVVTVPQTGAEGPTVSVLRPEAAPVPVKRLTKVGGDFIGWYGDGRRVHYSLGKAYFAYDLVTADSMALAMAASGDSTRARAAGTDTARAGRQPSTTTALAGADSARVARADTARRAPKGYEPERLDIAITVQRDRPAGTLVLRNARLVTMKGNEVIEKGDVVVQGNQILAVGPSGSVQVPAGATEIDATGRTILPGWLDIHAHLRPAFGVHKTQVWEYMANLAYGVTTTRDPQTGTTDVLSYGDLVETGEILGPRIFSTGPGVFWSENIASLDDARDVLRRYSEYYDTHTIKQYGAGDRKVRQWVIMAAKELGLMPTSENYLDFKKNLTEAMDGYPGAEHSYPIAPLYKDAVTLIAQSGITYTPTLLVNFGGPSGEDYWYTRHDVLRDTKLTRFTPRAELLRRGLRRGGWFHESQYVFDEQAREAAKIVAAGGRVGLGGHGQLQGLGVHWELWSIASGGMPAHEVLKVGTVYGAEAIGLEKELGTIEAGKLADLQILSANPLENIRNTNTIVQVMKNGRLYDASTLAETWPRKREIPKPWWLADEDLQVKAEAIP